MYLEIHACETHLCSDVPMLIFSVVVDNISPTPFFGCASDLKLIIIVDPY